MRVLILGCGYVGLPLGAELVRQGHAVTGLRRNTAAEAELRAAGITPMMADVTRPNTLRGLPADFDWVVYCVSSSGGGMEDYRKVYLKGMGNVLDWLACSPPRRFVYTSSTSVYGQADGSRVHETSPTEPVAETARILLAAEAVLLTAAQARKFAAVILRVAGIYGPARGYWLKQYLKGEARIEGRGERLLNMIHRDDVVGAIITALRSGRAGTIYNVTDDEPVSQLVLFEWLARKLDRPLPPFVPEDANDKSRRGLTSKKVSNGRMRSELGFQLKFPTFREGFAAEIAASTSYSC
jgi:nucleoside-diphosphate-sugar epimerase